MTVSVDFLKLAWVLRHRYDENYSYCDVVLPRWQWEAGVILSKQKTPQRSNDRCGVLKYAAA